MHKPNYLDLLGAALVWLAALSAARGAVTIDGPDGPVKPDRYARVAVGGLEDTSLARPIYYPRAGVDVVPVKTWGGEPLILFLAEQPGAYLLGVIDFGSDSYAEIEIQVGDAPEPKPDPPVPPPPPKVERLMVLVVTEESNPRQGVDARLADWNFIVRSPRIWKWLKENGHLIEVRDKDSTVERTNVPGGLAPWIERLGDAPLPHVFLFDRDTADCVADCPVPGIAEKSDEAFFALVRKWGMEK